MFVRAAGCAQQTPNAPVITSNGGGSTATVTITAPDTAITTVTSKASTARTYLVTSTGLSAGLFTIHATTGVLAFIAASVEGTYIATVTATTAYGSDSQVITITVDP